MVEMAVAAAILGSVLMMVTGILVVAGRGYRAVSTDAHGHDSLRTALGRLSADLRRSAPDRIAVDTSAADWDSLTLQVPVAYVGGATTWGAKGQVGNFIFYYVDDHSDLVRVMLDGTFAPTGQREILAQGVDRWRDGQKGFSLAQNGDSFTVSLRLLMEGGGTPWTREFVTAVTVRN